MKSAFPNRTMYAATLLRAKVVNFFYFSIRRRVLLLFRRLPRNNALALLAVLAFLFKEKFSLLLQQLNLL
jgi:hypothetical protein